MPINPILLSRILADAARSGMAGGPAPNGLGKCVLVGHLPSADVTVKPGMRTSIETMLNPPAAHAAGLTMDMVCWPLHKRGLSGVLSPTLKVGRDRANDVVLPDIKVSNVHAFISVDGDQFAVKDAGSANRTFVNARPLLGQMSQALSDGDTVSFGGVELTFMRTSRLMDLLLNRS